MIRMSDKCGTSKAQCLDDRNIIAYRKLLDTSKTNPILGSMLPFSVNEIKIAEAALKQYEKDCKRCAGSAKNDLNCLEVAKTNFERNMPSSHKDVYPWRNYDWNYGNYVANKYSTKALPAGNGSFSGVKKNVNNIVKSIDGLIFEPSPNSISNSFGTDRNSDYPVDDCNGNPVCITTESIKRNTQKSPTNDNFIKQFPIYGENSSSYYYKIGTCLRPDIKNMVECEKQGYKWTPSSIDEGGSCIQPRYMYIDNSPKPFINGSNGKGFIPSIMNDVMDIMPDKLFNSLLGQSTSGVQIQTCPNVEGFTNNDNITKKMISVILIGLMIIYISKKWK